jgi:hypothetical protein
LLLDASAGIAVGERAERAASILWDELGGDLAGASSNVRLWSLGAWAASRAEAGTVEGIVERMAENAKESGSPIDRTLSEAMLAQAAFSRGDTLGALASLASLSPEVIAATAEWHHAATLGFERLLEARLLLLTGRTEESFAVASSLDADALGYLLFLRPSLEIRIEAAEILGDALTASRLRDRLAATAAR